MNLQDDTIQLLVDLVEKEQRRLDQFQPDSQDYARRFHALMDRFADDQPLRKELLGLADREGLISIFVLADLDFRVKRTPLPEEEALDFIKHQDRQRRIYHDQHCKGDWGDAKCYDLVINSARLDIPGTVDILEQYIRSRAAQFDDRPAGE